MTENPITRSELREELRHYATEASLAKMEVRLVKWLFAIVTAAIALAATFTSIALSVLG